MSEGPGAEHPYVVRYWRLIEAFNRNDLVTVSEVLDPDLAYTIPGCSVVAGETHGIPAHIAMLRLARERSGDTLKLEPRSVAASGEYLFVFGRITARCEGRSFNSDHLVVFRFRGDRIVEGRTVPVDLYAFDAFWGCDEAKTE